MVGCGSPFASAFHDAHALQFLNKYSQCSPSITESVAFVPVKPRGLSRSCFMVGMPILHAFLIWFTKGIIFSIP